jgi:hypothetical protein
MNEISAGQEGDLKIRAMPNDLNFNDGGIAEFNRETLSS